MIVVKNCGQFGTIFFNLSVDDIMLKTEFSNGIVFFSLFVWVDIIISSIFVLFKNWNCKCTDYIRMRQSLNK